jgi:hypothetical protein
VMKLTKQAVLMTLTMLALVFSVSAQNLRQEKDPRNTAPTVGTGGPTGGPTGLFTVYDGQTLRKGEFTFSMAYSNYDRDPGNVDITEVPLNFQLGLTDYLEIFFNTDAYKGIKVNSPRNLSGFYLPNSRVNIGGVLQSPPAIILAPQGPGTNPFAGQAVFRPAGSQPFAQFPYVGLSTGNFGAATGIFTGPYFGFAAGSIPTIGAPTAGGAASMFPGMGSVYGGILPGIVLQTLPYAYPNTNFVGTRPIVYTLAPSYLPEAPFLNREFGASAFSTFTTGAKWRWTKLDNPMGVGVVAYYRWYADTAKIPAGFNQMQRGAGPGGNKGDVGVVLFADARVMRGMNISANLGYIYNSKVEGDFVNGRHTLLDRPDEMMAAIGFDFPVTKWFQPMLELRTTQYVGGRTPNVFENSPIEGIAGFRFFPSRWMSIGLGYRYHFNQQDDDSIQFDMNSTVSLPGLAAPVTFTESRSYPGVPDGFNTSSNSHGAIFQMTFGRRNDREGPIVNLPANVEAVTLTTKEIVLGCQPGFEPRAGASCPAGASVGVSVRASDPENDVLTYNYTVSGGRITGSGSNVTWDMSGLRPGTYTITAGVDDGCGTCGKTVTETVVVRECECVESCTCPTLSVTGGGIVESGQVMAFRANLAGGTGNAAVSYTWSVSNGRIVRGQGTSAIEVDTAGLDNTNITATVNISNPCSTRSCVTTASETGSVAKKVVEAVMIDEFGSLKPDDLRARIDAFIVALQNNPGNQGYIINYGTNRDVVARERLIRNHLAFRKFDASQVTFVRGGTTGPINSRLYRVPAGAENPRP